MFIIINNINPIRINHIIKMNTANIVFKICIIVITVLHCNSNLFMS